jgi:hypothetical protein
LKHQFAIVSSLSVQNLEELHYFESELKIFIDMAGMALWSDGKIENEESYFYINWLK